MTARPRGREATPEGRWRSYPYEELVQRDKCSLDIFWLRDESLEDSDNLPPPDVIAAEIVEDLKAALEQFAEIQADLTLQIAAGGDHSTATCLRGCHAMTLNDLLRAKGIDPTTVLVMRHRPFEPELNKVLPWLAAERPDVFNAYQQTQSEKVERAMRNAKYVASFIGHEGGKAPSSASTGSAPRRR